MTAWEVTAIVCSGLAVAGLVLVVRAIARGDAHTKDHAERPPVYLDEFGNEVRREDGTVTVTPWDTGKGHAPDTDEEVWKRATPAERIQIAKARADAAKKTDNPKGAA